MKKILYCITQADYGGAQKYVSELALNLSDKYITEIAVGERKKSLQEKWLKDLEEKNVKIWRLKHVVRELNIWHDFLSAFELLNLFRKSKPDIIHLNSSKIGSTGAVMGWIYKTFFNADLKVIYTVHGFVFNEPLPLWKKWFYLWSEKTSALCKNKIICVSEFDKICGLNNKIGNHKKLVTIHNGIDLDEELFDKSEAKEKLEKQVNLNKKTPTASWSQHSTFIGTIANLYSTKGLEYLIKSAKVLVEKDKNIKFIVIGEGGQRKNLEQEIKKFKLENNFFLIGQLPEAKKYLPAFDIFVLSSVKEGFPYCLIEALSAGLPVVCTQVGGVLEIIEPDENGLIVPAKKPKEFAKALEKILDNPDLAEKFRKNNLEKVKKFSLEGMIEKTSLVYNE